MARCMLCGSSTSLTSTVDTLTPHGSVCSSMIVWRRALIFSRSDSSSSRSDWPSTLRSVVCAICEVARKWSRTFVTASSGATTRK